MGGSNSHITANNPFFLSDLVFVKVEHGRKSQVLFGAVQAVFIKQNVKSVCFFEENNRQGVCFPGTNNRATEKIT